MSYKRYFDPAQVQSDQNDLMISQLKSELFDLKNQENDYALLNSNLNNLEHKYLINQEEKKRFDKESRIKTQFEQKNILKLKEETEIINQDIRSQVGQLQELRNHNKQLREMSDFRQKEQFRLKDDISQLQIKNQNIDDSIHLLNKQTKTLKDNNRRQQGELDNVSTHVEQKLIKNRTLEAMVKNLLADNSKLEKQLMLNQKQNDHYSMELRSKESSAKSQQQRLENNQNEQKNIQHRVFDIDKQNDKSKSEYLITQNNYLQEIEKNKELANHLKNQETEQRQKELEIEEMKGTFDQLKRKHFAMAEDNQQTNHELDKMVNVIEEVGNVNRDLMNEIETFAEQDQKAKDLLDRRNQMFDTLNRSDQKIKTSQSGILHLTGKKY